MKKFLFATFLFLGASFGLRAENITVSIDTRASYFMNTAEKSKLSGDYLNLGIKGNFDEHFSYNFYHHLNEKIVTSDILNATDLAYIQFNSSGWEIAGGKMLLEYGGWEFCTQPIDIYFGGEYWSNFSCHYSLGARVSRYFGDSKLSFQIANSAYNTANLKGLYTYSISWRGSENRFYQPAWSYNVMEYDEGLFEHHIVLGNRFKIGSATVDIDYINRSRGDDSALFGGDCSLVAAANLPVGKRLNVLLKYTRDSNTQTRQSLFVPANSTISSWGGGVEFFPLKRNRNIRLHCIASTRVTVTTVPMFLMGVTWRSKLFSL